MRGRWQLLFGSTLLALIGISWLAREDGVSVHWVSLRLLGMSAAAAFALYATVRVLREKWPAAVVLVCTAPMTLELVRVIDDVVMVVRFLGLPGVFIVVGPLVTTAIAVYILAAPVPPAPEDPIARAQVR